MGLGKIAQGSVLPAFAKTARVRNWLRSSAETRRKRRGWRGSSMPAPFIPATSMPRAWRIPRYPPFILRLRQVSMRNLTVQAAQAGKHVLCEKPLAATVEQSAQMVEACRRNGVLLMTAYRKYYEPSYSVSEATHQSGKLGRIDAIHTAFSELYTRCFMKLAAGSRVGGRRPSDGFGRVLREHRPLAGGRKSNRSHGTSLESRCGKVSGGRGRNFVSVEVSERTGWSRQFTYGAALSSFIFVQGTKGWASSSASISIRRRTASHAGRSANR